jgi:hypothetical protein
MIYSHNLRPALSYDHPFANNFAKQNSSFLFSFFIAQSNFPKHQKLQFARDGHGSAKVHSIKNMLGI